MPYKILILDDEETTRRTLWAILSQDYEVVESETIADAKEKLAKSAIQFVFADVHIGKESGLDFLRFVKQQESTARMPVVMMSAKMNKAVAEEARKLGAIACYSKPIEPNEIKRIVKEKIGIAYPPNRAGDDAVQPSVAEFVVADSFMSLLQNQVRLLNS
jgi:DNA-binding NtrC family response regulator